MACVPVSACLCLCICVCLQAYIYMLLCVEARVQLLGVSYLFHLIGQGLPRFYHPVHSRQGDL